jgi:beta-galactosidase
MLPGEPRSRIELRSGVRFRFVGAALETEPGMAGLDYDDSDWEHVELPHTWNANDATSLDMKRGVGLYRLRFRGPPLPPQARAYLRFAGVGTVSSVWLNGQALGSWFSGTAAVCYDVSAALRPLAENVALVRADNTARDDVPPTSGDFSMCGGLYRDVELVVTSSLAIDLLDHAGSGVYLTTPGLAHELGRVACRVRIRNAACSPREARVVLTVRDAQGAVVASAAVSHVADAGASEAELELRVQRPQLWRGRIGPYLYGARVELHDGNDGELLDAVEQAFGFRCFAVDAERGFLLNGEPYELCGVNLHQDGARAAWAMTPAERERDFELLLELGATFVRLVHYQHDPHAYALADRLGLVVWAEHALVNSVSEGPLFAKRATTQLTALIRQCFNHASIAVWGIGNEVQPHQPAAALLLSELAALAKREDPSRLSALATCYDEPSGAYGVDLLAHNKYFGWYYGSLQDLPTWLDAQRAKAPQQTLGMSEFGAGAGLTQHPAVPAPLDHSEAYQCSFHEAYWRALSQRPWLWCKAVWQMFDSAVSGRDEGDTPGLNDKGLVTRDRATKKDAFYWYKACWNPEPSVHITGKRWQQRPQGSDVKVYSSCDEVELRVNGASHGVLPVTQHVALFRGVELAQGENQLQALGRRAGSEVVDACVWTLA